MLQGSRNRAPAAPLAAVLMLVLSGCGGVIDKKGAQEFKRRVGLVEVAVLPALIRGKSVTYDDNSAREMAKVLNEKGLARALEVDEHLPISGEWRHNQAAMFRTTAEDLGRWVRGSSLQAEYVLMAEFLGEGRYVGIHVYVVDRGGTMVFGRLFNSHFREFRKISPKTPADGTALVVQYLQESLAKRD